MRHTTHPPKQTFDIGKNILAILPIRRSLAYDTLWEYYYAKSWAQDIATSPKMQSACMTPRGCRYATHHPPSKVKIRYRKEYPRDPSDLAVTCLPYSLGILLRKNLGAIYRYFSENAIRLCDSSWLSIYDTPPTLQSKHLT